MIRFGVDNAKEVQIEALLKKIENDDNDINDANTDILTIAEGHKREVGILSMLVVVIASKGSIKDIVFIISLITNISLVSICVIGDDIEKAVKSKVVRVLTKAGNTNRIIAI